MILHLALLFLMIIEILLSKSRRTHTDHMRERRFKTLPCLISASLCNIGNRRLACGQKFFCQTDANFSQFFGKRHAAAFPHQTSGLYAAVMQMTRKIFQPNDASTIVIKEVIDLGIPNNPAFLKFLF